MLTYRDLMFLLVGAGLYDLVCAAVLPDKKAARWFERALVPARVIAYGFILFLGTLMFIPLGLALLVLLGATLVGVAIYLLWRKNHPKISDATPSKEAKS